MKHNMNERFLPNLLIHNYNDVHTVPRLMNDIGVRGGRGGGLHPSHFSNSHFRAKSM